MKEFQFNFEADVEDSYLYYNRLRTRARKAKNRVAIDLLREYQLAQQNESINVNSSLESLNDSNNTNVQVEDDFRFPQDWRRDAGDRSRRVIE